MNNKFSDYRDVVQPLQSALNAAQQTKPAAKRIWSPDRKSPEQLASLYTCRLLFFDGNQRTWHQWKQEVIQQTVDGNYREQINHRSALEQLKQKIVYGKDERGRRFFNFIKSVLVYENLHNRLILKYLGKNKQYESKLGFITTAHGNVVINYNTYVDTDTGEVIKDVFDSTEIGLHIGRNRKFREEKEGKQLQLYSAQKGAQQ
jgi:hypothetical protein